MHTPHDYETKIPEEVAEDLVLLESKGANLVTMSCHGWRQVGRLAEFGNPVADDRTAFSRVLSAIVLI